jgi:hypothetical protein
MTSASSSMRLARPSEILVKNPARSSTLSVDQAGQAARAARTARSMSAAVPSGTRPITASLAESMTSMLPAPVLAIHAPSM